MIKHDIDALVEPLRMAVWRNVNCMVMTDEEISQLETAITALTAQGVALSSIRRAALAYLDAQAAYSKAQASAEVAAENYSNPKPELDALTAAISEASRTEKALRQAIVNAESHGVEQSAEMGSVPRDPTEAMLKAAAFSLLPSYAGQVDNQMGYDILSREDIALIWKVMFSAATQA
jgi:hypothetical protein